jgi:hypothetical protein
MTDLCGMPMGLPLRQVKGAYFNTYFSTWVQADVMVPAWQACVGVSTFARVPAVGNARVWITDVPTQPQVGPPVFNVSGIATPPSPPAK